MSLRFVTIDEQPDLAEQLGPLIDSIWPEFMQQDPIANQYWSRLFTDFSHCQFVLLDGSTAVGTANSIPVDWDGTDGDLPDEGWDWALSKGMADGDQHRSPRSLVGLQIAIAPSHQGRGLSYRFVQQLRDRTTQQGLDRLIIPVRPTHKHRYPLTPIARYIEWQNDGLPFDPWLRVHVRAGGRIVKPCNQAMTIRGTVAAWEAWTGLALPDSGNYIIPQALAPLVVDRPADSATYVEPNVWVEHLVT